MTMPRKASDKKKNIKVYVSVNKILYVLKSNFFVNKRFRIHIIDFISSFPLATSHFELVKWFKLGKN